MPAWGPQPHQIGSLTQAGSAWGTQPHQIGSLALIRGGVSTILKPQDVFATSLYTATGSTQTITSGIDLAGKGGLVWHKSRTNAVNHTLVDTLRGASNFLSSNTTTAETNGAGASSFLSNGHTYSTTSGDSCVDWSFARAAKFFDIVTWTGDGTSNRQIPHGLGVVPGMVIVKRRDAASSWFVTHRSLPQPFVDYLALNLTGGSQPGDATLFRGADAASFSVGSASPFNASGGLFVAYLFAHDASADGIVQCGSFTTDASGNASISLSWTPQWGIFKSSSAVSNWFTLDTARGWGAGVDNQLNPNTSNAESTATDFGAPLAGGGFSSSGIVASGTVIYAVIRAPY